MLTHLSIQNVVLIERAGLEFGAGLCVLTGETGAGKSILLDALGLALGERGEARLVRKGAEKALVTAEFEVAGNAGVAALLEALGVEADGSLLVRRQLGADGKSRAFVNDQPVSVKALKQLGEMLVEVHGQHQQRGLMDAGTHGGLLDGYGMLEADVAAVRGSYRDWQAAVKALERLQAEIEKTAREKEYLEHMRGELKALNPLPGEEEALTDQRTRMMQSEKLAHTLDDVLGELGQPHDVAGCLRSAQSALMRSTLKDAEMFSPAIEALERAMDEVAVVQEVIEELGNNCAFDERELEEVEERLFALKDAGRKYNLPLDELPDLFAQVKEKLALLATQEAALGGLVKEEAVAKTAFQEAAAILSEKRCAAGKKLEAALHKELEPLKMAATRFRVVVEPLQESGWSERGIDRVRFETATNKGSDFGPLEQIASGGELSRFMLALAVVLGEVKATPVMIFDEIDTGTGGAVADAIGRRLERLSANAQVLVVTHLPQVAARGAHHLFIEKAEDAGQTSTQVRTLDGKQRREELARMLSGAKISHEARHAADKLLEAG